MEFIPRICFDHSQVDAITASKRCNLTNVLKCGGKVHKIEDSNDTFDACTIVFKRPSIASNISKLHPEAIHIY